ncbi:MAG: protein translocase subunit SecD [Candidatus Cloacimonetes bacterium]|nr:protein translocase subunit SecD [Candidatus Cloacimonadota bacterium]
MKAKRLRNILIIVVLVVIAFYLTPLFLTVFSPSQADRLDTSLLPWTWVVKSLSEEGVEGKTVRVWSGKQLNLGLDLQGGMQVDMSLDFDAVDRDWKEKERNEAIESALQIIRNRIDQFGVAEPILHRVTGKNRIVLQLPGVKNFSRTKILIQQAALLEFKIVAEQSTIDGAIVGMNKFLQDNLDEYLVRYPQLDRFVRIDEAAEANLQEALADDVLSDDEESDSLLADSEEGDEVAVDAESDTTAVAGDIDLAMTASIFSNLTSFQGYPLIVPAENIILLKKLLADAEFRAATPSGWEFLLGKKDKAAPTEPRRLYLVEEEPQITGAYLSEARVRINQGDDPTTAGETTVGLEFNKEGTRLFADVTGRNIDRLLAIVLDDVVFMAPVIRDKIRGPGTISGLSDTEEAQDLVIVLNAGNLDAPIYIESESFVGPTLGSDSIRAGFRSFLIGLIIVGLFMLIYYRLSGLMADIALLVNIGFVLAALTMLEAALTLPGIAGLILTIGMAVDANVLIFERIREERRAGKSVRSAVDRGFSRAIVTILDANITTLITAIVLYQFGTGPLRGFAVTLSIGIIGSMFCAIILMRAIFDTFITNKKREKLSI